MTYSEYQGLMISQVITKAVYANGLTVPQVNRRKSHQIPLQTTVVEIPSRQDQTRPEQESDDRVSQQSLRGNYEGVQIFDG